MMLREPYKDKKTVRALGATRVAQGDFRSHIYIYIFSALINEIFCNERDPPSVYLALVVSSKRPLLR